MKRGVGLEVLILMEIEKRKYRRLRRLVEEVEERRIPASAGKPDLAGKPAGWDDIAAGFPTWVWDETAWGTLPPPPEKSKRVRK
jgi:hypothetical protein